MPANYNFEAVVVCLRAQQTRKDDGQLNIKYGKEREVISSCEKCKDNSGKKIKLDVLTGTIGSVKYSNE